MCEAKPGPRCASDTCENAQTALSDYDEAAPQGPLVDPLNAAQPAPRRESTPLQFVQNNPEFHRERRGHDFYPSATEMESWPAIYANDDTPARDSVVVAHYFQGGADWYVTEVNPETGESFGYADLGHGGGELGYTNLVELERVHGQLGMPIERDLHFTRAPLGQVLADSGKPVPSSLAPQVDDSEQSTNAEAGGAAGEPKILLSGTEAPASSNPADLDATARVPYDHPAYSYWAKVDVAANPHTTPETLHYLATTESEDDFKLALARNPNTNAEDVDLVSDHYNISVRRAAIENPKLSPKALQQMMFTVARERDEERDNYEQMGVHPGRAHVEWAIEQHEDLLELGIERQAKEARASQ